MLRDLVGNFHQALEELMGSAVLSFAADILLGRFILLKQKTFQPFKSPLTLKPAGILTLPAKAGLSLISQEA